MLYLIGLGLNDEKDISVKGLEAVRSSSKIFLENYTSVLSEFDAKKMEKMYGKKIILASRDMVENKSEEILNCAHKENVAFLVVGDVFAATTHTDLFIRAKEKKIKVKVINNASVMNAVGITGLQLYKFGRTTSIVFPQPNYKPETAYDVIKQNKKNGMHTLVLLDINIPEVTDEQIKEQFGYEISNKNKSIIKTRFMTVNEAVEILSEIESKRKEKVFNKEMMILGCARLGSDSQIIKYGKVNVIAKFNFGKPLHCLVIPGKMHFLEEEMLNTYK